MYAWDIYEYIVPQDYPHKQHILVISNLETDSAYVITMKVRLLLFQPIDELNNLDMALETGFCSTLFGYLS